MLILRGAPALSAFRHGKLLSTYRRTWCRTLSSRISPTSPARSPPTRSRCWRGCARPSVPVQEPSGRLFQVLCRHHLAVVETRPLHIALQLRPGEDRPAGGIAYYVQGELFESDAQQVRASALHDRMTRTGGAPPGRRRRSCSAMPQPARLPPAPPSMRLAAVRCRCWRRPTSSWAWPWPRTRSTTC
ncbi:hypothetical protein P4204_27335 [Pseudomonas aeruginosa]|nr:hypothetical protein [Pseudomonas aeruginosa]